MARIVIDVPMPRDFGAFVARVRESARRSLYFAATTIQSAVIDFAPRWTGGLQSRILIRPERGGDQQTVYAEGVVARVMENGATWPGRWPPHAPIKAWVEGKLGISGKPADRVAFLIRRKFKRLGLKVPLPFDGRGAMFRRAYALMARTRAYFLSFAAAFRSTRLSG